MIDINLVPPHLRKKSNFGILNDFPLDLPSDIVAGVGAGTVILLLLTHISLFLVMGVNQARLVATKLQWDALLPDKKNLDAIGQEVRDLKKKTTDIDDLVNKHAITWSRNLNVISDSLSSGVWLKRLTLNSKSLIIEGSAVAKGQDEVAAIGSLVNTLKKDVLWMKAFSGIEVNSIQRLKLHNTDIADFTITAKLQ